MVGKFFISQDLMDKLGALKNYGRDFERDVTNRLIIDNGCHPDAPIMVQVVFEDVPDEDPNVCGLHWEQHVDRNALYEKLYPSFDKGMSLLSKSFFFTN